MELQVADLSVDEEDFYLCLSVVVLRFVVGLLGEGGVGIGGLVGLHGGNNGWSRLVDN